MVDLCYIFFDVIICRNIEHGQPVHWLNLQPKRKAKTMEQNIIEEVVVEEEVVTEETVVTEEPKVNYVKERVDRAKAQTTKAILTELGVDDVVKAKELIAQGTQALQEVARLRDELASQKANSERKAKVQQLTSRLNNEKVFDADALLNYIDLDKVQIEDDQVQDLDGIVENLRQAKPHFFGVTTVTSDNYTKGQNKVVPTARDKQAQGNVVGAIDDYLKHILK